MAVPISKSEQKRRSKQVEEVAAELAGLTENDLRHLPAGPELLAEIRAVRGLKGGARQRQIKYLAKLLREQELTPVYDFLSQRKGSELQDQQLLHEAERIRDSLINEALAAQEECRRNQQNWDGRWPSRELPELSARYPGLDILELQKGVLSYVRSRNRMYYRELFRSIRAAMELQAIRQKMSSS